MNLFDDELIQLRRLLNRAWEYQQGRGPADRNLDFMAQIKIDEFWKIIDNHFYTSFKAEFGVETLYSLKKYLREKNAENKALKSKLSNIKFERIKENMERFKKDAEKGINE